MSAATQSSAAAGRGQVETNAEQSARIDRLLTVKEVCERLQISTVTGWRLYSERGLRVVHIGRSIRVREADLAAWLEKNASDGSEGRTQ